jgi:Fur family ferric uptake transcriptional regulator
MSAAGLTSLPKYLRIIIVTIITTGKNFLRKTEQRTVILEELRLCRNHPGADEVYLRVRERLPHISLGTVYRNLELMASRGMIRRLDTSSGQKRFDPITEQHCHFRCNACGNIEDIPFAVEFPQLDPRHPWVQERKILGARPEYFGLCPACLDSSENQETESNGRVTP